MGSKVVLDTNVLISAFGWKGASRKIFHKCIKGELDLFLTIEMFDELKRVVNYPKFKFSQAEIDEFLDQILEIGSLVEPGIKLEIIKEDPSDNKFFECAVAVAADYIISRDPHVLKVKEYKGIKIISPEAFKQES